MADNVAVKSHPMVLVIWRDAEGSGEQESRDDVIHGAIGIERSDIGYLVRDDAEGVIISGTQFVGDDSSIDRRLSIPRSFIKEVKRLTVKRKKGLRVNPTETEA